MTCDSRIEEMNISDLIFHQKTTFGCCYNKKIQYYAAVCSQCPYNAYFFHRNYFADLSCASAYVHKHSFCRFSENLKDNFNYRVQKVCVEVKDKDSFPFKIIPIDNYF